MPAIRINIAQRSIQRRIGPVAEALAEALGVKGVLRRSVEHLSQTIFVGDRLLNESGLEKHPLNPMTDPDIRR
jgi:uncharacterized protein YgbK (DUF1537 family)